VKRFGVFLRRNGEVARTGAPRRGTARGCGGVTTRYVENLAKIVGDWTRRNARRRIIT